jgi:SSS family solute:Na+ symporter
MAQFFEMRYSRKFRIYAGFLAWVAGVLNFGVFPGVGTRFFISFCGFPQHFEFLGLTWTTYPVLMAILIGVALYFTFTGGQIAVLITDFWQGLIAMAAFACIVAFLWFKFPWSTIGEGLIAASAPGKSLINPFDIGSQRDFNVTYYLIGWFFYYYGFMAWQGNQAYNCSATTAHEAKMAGVLTQFRAAMIGLGLLLVPLIAITIMHHPAYAETASQVTADLQKSYPNSSQMRESMTVPMAISHYLPIGLAGALVTARLGYSSKTFIVRYEKKH